MARMVESSSTFTLNVRTNGDSLGKLLAEAKTDWKKIFLDVLIRAAISALAVWVWSRRGGTSEIVNLICYVGLLVFTAYPLIHMGDAIGFYENGVRFRKKQYPFRSQSVQWLGREGVGSILGGRYLVLGGHAKQINASYVQSPEEAFSSAYQSLGLK